MNRYHRSWPAAVTAIVLGGLLGVGVTAWLTTTNDRRLGVLECECPVPDGVGSAATERPVGSTLTDRGNVVLAEGRTAIVGPTGTSAVLVLRSPPLDWAAVERLLDDLRTSPDARARRRAAARLATVEESDRVMGALMIALLTDEDRYVRANAAEAMGRVGGAIAVQPLGVAVRQDPAARVRESAALGLGLTGQPLAVPVLADVLEHDASDVVRLRAAKSLSEIGAGSSMPSDALRANARR